MSRVLVSLVLLALASSPLLAAHEISLVLWNVETLREGRFLPEQIRAKLKNDAKVLKALDADILGLSEVESPALLDKLIRRKLHKLGYIQVAVGDADTPEGFDVALVSRLPFETVLREMPKGSRGLVLGRFEDTAGIFYVLVVHGEEGATPDHQAALAKRLRTIVFDEIPSREGQDTPVILLGDLEFTPQAPAFQALISAGFIDTMSRLAPDIRWTHAFTDTTSKPHLVAFDHVLITPALARGKTRHWVEGSSRARRLTFMRRTRKISGQKISWPIDDRGRDLGFSDHFPIMARLWVVDPVPTGE